MKQVKLLLALIFIYTGSFAQSRMYNLTLSFDSVKVRKLLMTSILEGGANDSVLVKKPNGGLFKVARSSFGGGGGSGTVTSFSKVDGFGIISSVTNPTTTPAHTIRVDTTTVRSVLNSYTKAQVDAKISGSYVDLTTNQTAAGNKTWTGDVQTFSGLGVRFDQNAYYKHRSSVNQIAGYGVISTGSDNSWKFSPQTGVNRYLQFYPPDNNTAYVQFRSEDSSITPKLVAYTVQNIDQEITDPTKGIILSSPNGTRWRVTVSNAGALVVTSL